VNGVEKCNEFRIEWESIRQNEWKRIIPLGFNIHAYNLKAHLTVTDACAARAAEKVEKSRFASRWYRCPVLAVLRARLIAEDFIADHVQCV
jgi:hypothetical protein